MGLIFVAEIFVGEGLVDDGELALPFHLGFGERAAVDELNFEDGEITFAAKVEERRPFFCVSLAGNFDVGLDATVGRKRAGFCGFKDAGYGFETIEERTEETGELVGGFVTVLGKRKARDENVIGLQAEVDVAKGDEAAHQEAGGDEERERDSDFEDDDGVAQAAMSGASAGAFATVAERVVEITTGDLERGDQAEHEGGEDGDG